MYFYLPVAICLSIAELLAATAITSSSTEQFVRRPARIEDFPYQVSIEVLGHHEAGGSIIADHWVLTSWSNIYDVPASNLAVRSGTVLRNSSTGRVHQVDRVVHHEDYRYSPGEASADIALLRVTKAFVFGDACRAIELPEAGRKPAPGSVARVSGWGRIADGSYLELLHYSEVLVMDTQKCNRTEHPVRMARGSLCAGSWEFGPNACGSDFGGPLAQDKRLIGIVSWNKDCEKIPTVFTDVAYYRHWIDRHVKSGGTSLSYSVGFAFISVALASRYFM